RGGLGGEAPAGRRAQLIAGQVGHAGRHRGGVDGVVGQRRVGHQAGHAARIADRGRHVAAGAGGAQGDAGGGDGGRIHRLTEGGADGGADRDVGGVVERRAGGDGRRRVIDRGRAVADGHAAQGRAQSAVGGLQGGAVLQVAASQAEGAARD